MLVKVKTCFCVLLIPVIFIKCSLETVPDDDSNLKALAAIEKSITEMENQPLDWQRIINALDTSLSPSIQMKLTYDLTFIEEIGNKIIQSVNRCGETLKIELIYYLQYAKAQLNKGQTPPKPITNICNTSPISIDLNATRSSRVQIRYTGYYIHSKDSLSAALINSAGTLEIKKLKFAYPDFSNITVSIDDISDETIEKYTHLILKYSSEVISTVGIIKKQAPPPPMPETDYSRIEYIDFVPKNHLEGDLEFNGNGPKMIAHLYLKQDGLKAYARVYLYARETKSDWSTVDGYSEWKEIYTVKSGYRINKINEPTIYIHILRINGQDYIDYSHGTETLETTVGTASLVGDTAGSEIKTKTKISLKLRKFAIEIQKS